MNKSELAAVIQKGIDELENRRRWIKAYQGNNSKSTFLAVKDDLDKATLKDITKWLNDEVITTFDNARKLCRDEVWSNYQLMGITDLREQIILKKTITALVKHITARPAGVVIRKECHEKQDQ